VKVTVHDRRIDLQLTYDSLWKSTIAVVFNSLRCGFNSPPRLCVNVRVISYAI